MFYGGIVTLVNRSPEGRGYGSLDRSRSRVSAVHLHLNSIVMIAGN
jgi:hypothetical protein